MILAGPNGSGKSTFFNRRLAKWGLPFLNPDIIAKQLNPDDPSQAALQATRQMGVRRQEMLDKRASFIVEGIRPDPYLIEQANQLRYSVRVVFLCTENSAINATRVMERVESGGHNVPLGAIVARYDRALQSLPAVVGTVDRLLLFDNSIDSNPMRLVAHFHMGTLVSVRRRVPAWAERVFSDEFRALREKR